MFGRKDQFAFATSTLGEAARAGAGSELNNNEIARKRFMSTSDLLA
jgi:hypothetical protein